MSKTPRATFVVSAHVFLLKDNKILLTRRFQTGYEDGKYSVPAGHLENGEMPSEAAVREAKEEVGVTISLKNIQFAHVMPRIHDRQSIDFFFVCKKWSGDPCIAEPDKCDDLKWVPLNRLPRNTIPYTKLAIKALREKKVFSEAHF